MTVFAVYDCGDLVDLFLSQESAERRRDEIRESTEREFWDNIIVHPITVKP